MRAPELRATLGWFQASVVAPHETRTRRLAPAARHLRPSTTLRPEQRLGIYVDAYMARLVEALEEDFPALAHRLGHRAFHRLCRAYLEGHPSRSRSLNVLGRKLPGFLPGGAAGDLARLEAAMSEVFDGQAVEPLRPADFSRMTPATLARARLDCVPTLRLLALDHDANPYVDAVRQERDAVPPLKRKRSWVAVYRKEFKVCRLDLREAGFEALTALRRSRTVSQAVAAAARCWKGTASELQKQVRQWFGEWVCEGFFFRVR
ncbi:MAG TPA: DNA-binding domain-containing protein [Planctomycetota bacterium]|nr:DNA-binding domain-containing protein [Planctomycetota bacterium]